MAHEEGTEIEEHGKSKAVPFSLVVGSGWSRECGRDWNRRCTRTVCQEIKRQEAWQCYTYLKPKMGLFSSHKVQKEWKTHYLLLSSSTIIVVHNDGKPVHWVQSGPSMIEERWFQEEFWLVCRNSYSRIRLSDVSVDGGYFGGLSMHPEIEMAWRFRHRTKHTFGWCKRETSCRSYGRRRIDSGGT